MNKLFIDTVPNEEREQFSLNFLLTSIDKICIDPDKKNVRRVFCKYRSNKYYRCIDFHKHISCMLTNVDLIKLSK